MKRELIGTRCSYSCLIQYYYLYRRSRSRIFNSNVVVNSGVYSEILVGVSFRAEWSSVILLVQLEERAICIEARYIWIQGLSFVHFHAFSVLIISVPQ